MDIDSNVIIQNLTPKAREHRKRLWGLDFEGKKGKVVDVLINSRGEQQGYRIRFPVVKIAVSDNEGLWPRENFEYPFYNSEVSLLGEEEELVFPISGGNGERKGRTRKGRETDIKTVKRLRRKGHKVNELAKRFEVSRQTIHQWLRK